VSVAGLACYRPGARSRLFYRLRVHRGRKGERRAMSEAGYAALVTAAHTQLAAPVILIWDNLNTHISARMRAWIEARADWLTVERLPAYAPQLNAVAGAWTPHEEQPHRPPRGSRCFPSLLRCHCPAKAWITPPGLSAVTAGRSARRGTRSTPCRARAETAGDLPLICLAEPRAPGRSLLGSGHSDE